MIDSYMDRADAATGYRPTPRQPVDRDDPRYFACVIYETPSAARALEALGNLHWALTCDCLTHKTEMRHGIRMGSAHSAFDASGRRK